MTRIILFLFLIAFAQTVQAQSSPEVDSLKTLLKTLDQDTNRVRVLAQMVSKVRRYDIEEARIYADEAFPLAQKLDDQDALCGLHLQYCIMDLSQGKAEQAMKWAKDGIALCGEIGNQKRQATAYFLASNLQLTLGNIDAAQEYANESIIASDIASYTYGKILGYKAVGDIEETRGNLTEALSNYEQGLAIATDENIQSQIMVMSNNMGIAYDELGWHNKALEYYLRAAEIAEKQNDVNGLINFWANIADIYGIQNQNQKALDLSLKALNKAQSASNRRALPSLYSQIGSFYGRLGKTTEQEQYHVKSKEISEELGNQRSLSFALDNLGQLYENKGQLEKAENAYRECLRIREEIDYKGGLSRIHNSLGNFYYGQGQYQRALGHFQKGKDISEEMQFVEQMNKHYRDLAKCYAALGNHREAYALQELHIATKDTLWNEDRNRQISMMNAQFDTEQKEIEIAQLESEATLMAEARQKDQQIKYLLLAAAALLAALVFLFFNRSRTMRKKNAIIQQTSKQLAASLSEKETLLKEIHHRVKNNLQIISSLLNLQTRQVEDEKTLSTIQEGQSRVQAMSLIHQKLYQSERLSKVDIETYLEELAENLSRMFDRNDQQISVDVTAPDIEFDIDTAIPLGLIVNELISNAYKYAFDGRDQGNIKVAIKSLGDLEYELTVQDDGDGLPEGFANGQHKSLGLRLVYILSQQLRGNVDFASEGGATIKVQFKDVRAFQEAA